MSLAALTAIDPLIAGAVFASSFILDWLYTRYTYYLMQKRAEMAATLAFIWHLLGAVMVVQYADNAAYILFVCAGGALGTWVTVSRERRQAEKAQTPPGTDDKVVRMPAGATNRSTTPAEQAA